VPGTTSGDKADLSRPRRIATEDHLVLVIDPQFRMGGVDTEQ
jgi:hypothetical protein